MTSGRCKIYVLKYSGLFFFIVWWIVLCWSFSFSLPRTYSDPKDTIFYLGCGILIIYQLLHKRDGLKISPNIPTILILIYLLIAISSVVTASNAHYEGLLSIARMILWVGVIWCIAQQQIIWKTVMQCSVISATLIAMLSWLALKGINMWYDSFPILAPIGHTSYFGDFMALHIPMAVFLLLESRRFWQELVWGCCLLLITLGLLISETRASQAGVTIALIVITIVVVWCRILKWKQIAGAAVAVCIAVTCLVTIQPVGFRHQMPIKRFQDTLSSMWSSPTGAGILSGRWYDYLNTVKAVSEHPILGWGLGSFRFVYPEYGNYMNNVNTVSFQTWFMHPHNELLSQVLETGYIGLIVFLGLWTSIIYAAIKRLEMILGPSEQRFIITALAGVVISLVSWQFSTNFLFPLSRLLTAFYVAIIWKLAAPQFSVVLRIPIRRLVTILLTAIICFSTLILMTYSASLYAKQRAREETQIEKQLRWAKASYYLAPGAFDSTYTYAGLLLQAEPIEKARPVIDELYSQYPFVPAVLYITAILRVKEGRIKEAPQFLEHALKNDPAFGKAKNLLDQIHFLTTPNQLPGGFKE